METFLKEVIEGKKIELLIDTNIFSKDIILKSAYTFLDKGYFFFKQNEDKNIVLQCVLKDGIDMDLNALAGEFADELLSTILRANLEKENKEIREKIVGAAISNSLDSNNFIALDTDQKFNENDNREQNEIDFDKDIDEILKEIENDPDLKIDENEIEKILQEIEEETEPTKPKITINPDAVKKAKDNFNK